MLKQIIIILVLAVFLGTFMIAKEKPETERNDSNKKIVQTEPDNSLNEMYHNMKMDDTISANPKIWNKVCPVKGNPIEANSPTVEYNGKVYAFCCPGCDTKFAKNPEKYAKNLSEDGKKFVGKK